MEPYLQVEAEWASFNGLSPECVVACSSGTAALHLALESLQLPQVSLVVVPDICMIACPRAVSMAGLVPILVGVTDKLQLDTDLLNNILYRWPGKISSIMVVHTYGRTTDMNQLHDIADRYGVSVIEDLAEAHGIRPHPRTDAACWSFYKNKIVCGEEGGAVAFRDAKQASLARKLRCLGFTDAHDFKHIPRGHNYRMSNLHAAPILDSIRNFSNNLAKRRLVEQWYDERCPSSWRLSPRDAPWVYDLRILGMTNIQQHSLVRELRKIGVPARHCFKPTHSQEEYCKSLSVTDSTAMSKMSEEIIYLGISPSMTRYEVQRNMDAVLAYDFL